MPVVNNRVFDKKSHVQAAEVWLNGKGWSVIVFQSSGQRWGPTLTLRVFRGSSRGHSSHSQHQQHTGTSKASVGDTSR